MPEFEHNLTKTEVTWGLISVARIREYFPGPSEKIIVYDSEGRKCITKMHSSAARIDGLTDWYNNYSTVEIGDSVVIVINPDKSIKLFLKKETEIYTEEKREKELSAIEIVPSMERLLEDFLEKNLLHIEKGLNYTMTRIISREDNTPQM